jgi:hypothetical protein
MSRSAFSLNLIKAADDSVPAVLAINSKGDRRARWVGINPAIANSETSNSSSTIAKSTDMPCPTEGFAARTIQRDPSGIVAEFRPKVLYIFAPKRSSRSGASSSKSIVESDKV